MKFFSTPYEKKSAIITSLIGFLLILIFFVIGLTFFDPPISYGVEVNFGTLSNEKLIKKVALESSKTPINKTSTINEFNDSELKSKAAVQKKSIVSFDDKSNSPKTKKKSLDKKKIDQSDSLVYEEVPKSQPEISKLTKKILNNIISAEVILESNENTLNENESKIDSGNPYSNTYYNQTGLIAERVGFGLNGRNLKSNGSVKPQCDQEGKVVVRITVNKMGNVVNAEAGVKGSTNVHPCLLEPAKKTAFLHKWFSDENAPDSQIGFVVVNFKLVD
ncbi:MAG: hypothetical protein VXY15_03710 [Bacteroidota bacterium]|nr:hypothetical protein [Bacteroidota bacterium]